MDLSTRLRRLLDDTLNLEGRGLGLVPESRLMGALPELDSMGVVALLTAFEDQLGVTVDDDDIDGEVFATFGSLLAFVQARVPA